MRPDQPGAHFFTVFEELNKDEMAAMRPHALAYQTTYLQCGVAAPSQTTATGRKYDWGGSSNMSAYIIDSGLWTACKESREAMEKRWKIQHWTQNRELAAKDNRWGERDVGFKGAPAMGLIPSKDSVRFQAFTVVPNSDLFCVQPFDFASISWEGLLSSVPFFHYSWGWDQVLHIALEFDPSWAVDLNSKGSISKKPTLLNLCRALDGELEWGSYSKVWLIDYSIERRRGEPLNANRKQFAGHNCRFVEVQEGDPGWLVNGFIIPEYWYGRTQYEKDKPSDVFEFLAEIREWFDCWNEDMKLNRRTPSISGVMACERDKTR
ncbi:uncharacterized protein E0L32_006585 [Thyridium curvatum]|uniref:Uncharacterized protein n=1 Tax=Thyridium curvatum TaxID=1093900 RepID=A0A507B8H7_9PEZI|nr:uncharacterized protein E0L32_006585 [Thyridium curvatum]TPX12940.1 hypothetical protein E0L32_006585 [Thyridium curvatum]